MAPGFFFAVLMIFGFALFVVDRVAFFNPFSFGYCYLVFAAFLTLNFFDLAYHRNCYWIAYLKKSSNQISFSFLPSKILLPVHNVHNNIAADIRFRILVNNNLGRDNHICLCQKLLKKIIAFFSNSHFFFLKWISSSTEYISSFFPLFLTLSKFIDATKNACNLRGLVVVE